VISFAAVLGIVNETSGILSFTNTPTNPRNGCGKKCHEVRNFSNFAFTKVGVKCHNCNSVVIQFVVNSSRQELFGLCGT
jgi:hypothetical protein